MALKKEIHWVISVAPSLWWFLSFKSHLEAHPHFISVFNRLQVFVQADDELASSEEEDSLELNHSQKPEIKLEEQTSVCNKQRNRSAFEQHEKQWQELQGAYYG